MSHSGYRILHTSDWHLGNSLHGHPRIDEYKAFLKWLKFAIVDNEIDALLVSGDIFDTGSPSNAAEELYYSFLTSLNGTSCKSVVITAGNHDSPSTLAVSRSVLGLLNVHVVATPDPNVHFANEILPLPNAEAPEVIVCAAPFLRDRALQASLGNAESATSEQLVRNGTAAHFSILKEHALRLREEYGKSLPIVAMAHLFAAGAALSENAEETEFSIVGNLENVNTDIFPPDFDYVALGHIHRPQKVGGEDRIRYSGSPLPMGFDEAERENVVLVVEFRPGSKPQFRPLGVPRFCQWKTISGNDAESIRVQIAAVGKDFPGAMLRIRYTGSGNMGNLRQAFAEDVKDAGLELVHAEYVARASRSQAMEVQARDLSELTPSQIFEKQLDAMDFSQEPGLKPRVFAAFEEILKKIQNGEE